MHGYNEAKHKCNRKCNEKSARVQNTVLQYYTVTDKVQIKKCTGFTMR